ncbi:MAG: hypothetical protein K9N06_02090 [Candidatus Cloacimonetes bacterium]|nr:hypothetical protein [Candidatus Cloacimonadota bacterium]
MKDNLITLIWAALLLAVIAILALPQSRGVFIDLTKGYPYLMGLMKVGLLGTMGELLSGKIVIGKWKLSGIRIGEKFLVWAFLGVYFTAIFPMFSYGVEGLQKAGLLPGAYSVLLTSFWKSFLLNMVFGFPMMCFHRLTDTAIEKGGLFRRWNIPQTFLAIDWDNMFKVVGGAIFWFWIPAQVVTFLLPPEFRVMSAALLAIALGLILGIAKKLSLQRLSNIPA